MSAYAMPSSFSSLLLQQHGRFNQDNVCRKDGKDNIIEQQQQRSSNNTIKHSNSCGCKAMTVTTASSLALSSFLCEGGHSSTYNTKKNDHCLLPCSSLNESTFSTFHTAAAVAAVVTTTTTAAVAQTKKSLKNDGYSHNYDSHYYAHCQNNNTEHDNHRPGHLLAQQKQWQVMITTCTHGFYFLSIKSATINEFQLRRFLLETFHNANTTYGSGVGISATATATATFSDDDDDEDDYCGEFCEEKSFYDDDDNDNVDYTSIPQPINHHQTTQTKIQHINLCIDSTKQHHDYYHQYNANINNNIDINSNSINAWSLWLDAIQFNLSIEFHGKTYLCHKPFKAFIDLYVLLQKEQLLRQDYRSNSREIPKLPNITNNDSILHSFHQVVEAVVVAREIDNIGIIKLQSIMDSYSIQLQEWVHTIAGASLTSISDRNNALEQFLSNAIHSSTSYSMPYSYEYTTKLISSLETAQTAQSTAASAPIDLISVPISNTSISIAGTSGSSGRNHNKRRKRFIASDKRRTFIPRSTLDSILEVL